MIPYQQLKAMHRIDLAKAIPLAAPLALFLEPTNVCNFKCPICPESLKDYRGLAGYYEAMPARIWNKVYGDLWARLRVLRFYDLGEPMLNRELFIMTSEARHLGLADRLELTTNGSLLTKANCEALCTSGLDYVRVSIYGTTDEEYWAATGSRCATNQVQKGMARLMEIRSSRSRPYIYAHLVMANPTEWQREEFRRTFEGLADELGIEPALHNWGGNDDRLVRIGAQPSPGKRICAKPFYELTVHANGDVSACCADWRGQLHLGNVERESLLDIWHGQRLRAIQQAHLAGAREGLAPCNGCTLIHNQVDDLDGLLK
jgi:radical SAM protein with 4Fe4S-binding SPASM domain